MKKGFKLLALVFFISLIFTNCKRNNESSSSVIEKIKGEEKAVLTDPPIVPPPITRKHATKVIVNLEVIEKEMEIMDGVKYNVLDFWWHSVPGKLYSCTSKEI
jgi:nitrite reductase (NO-forming)